MEHKKTKIIAFHLPQFHSFPENDEWWGKGFTEWTNTRKAVPQFKGHNQPRQPMNDEYYDLLDYGTRKWQAEIAKEYGIYGFCYYHYWFNGKLLMERPVEMLLKEKEISLPFCFCWANESWSRAWDGKANELLIEQKDGGIEDWNKHIEYLLPFFKDSRYIKVNNKPMYVIYRTENINNYDDMIEYWDCICKKNGFDGLYVIEERNSFQDRKVSEHSSAVLDFEPMYTLTKDRSKLDRLYCRLLSNLINLKKGTSIRIIDYDSTWKRIVKRKYDSSEKIYLGAFVDWDNSPRKKKGQIICKGVTPQKFEKYISQQIKHAKQVGSEYIFINAWNEWAEGTYLEPDKVNKYAYLEAIKRSIGV